MQNFDVSPTCVGFFSLVVTILAIPPQKNGDASKAPPLPKAAPKSPKISSDYHWGPGFARCFLVGFKHFLFSSLLGEMIQFD